MRSRSGGGLVYGLLTCGLGNLAAGGANSPFRICINDVM